MKTAAFDASRIESMLNQLRAAATRPQGLQSPIPAQAPAAPKVNFADTLKASLDQVNNVQKKAEKIGEAFALGDDRVSLTETMVSMQKASIAFQATVQVRNKLVSAYHDVMNMQV